jgi:hypothetical protein
MMAAGNPAPEFARVDATKRADIHRLRKEREQILWVMATSKTEVGVDFLTPA